MRLSTIVRSFARARGLALAVTLTVAAGVAALTVTFGVVNAALFRQPPFDDARRVAMLYLQRHPEGEAPRRERWSFARFQLLAASQRSFETVASYSPATLTLAGDTEAELVRGERVSASYFPLLRVRATRGRVFTDAEDDAARPTHVAVIGHSLWMRRWAGDPSVVGRTVRLNGVPLTVIGVLPAGFGGLSGQAEIWIPRTLSPQITYAEYLTTNQNFISAVGRLRPGVGLDAAVAELTVLGGAINRVHPSEPQYPNERVSATAVSLDEARTDATVRRSLVVLLGAVALLHLLACANVANLLLGRAAAKRRDAAVQLALGSGSGRLFAHTLAEGCLLAVIGGAAGIALAWRASAIIAPPANVWAPRNFYGSLAPFDTPAFSLVELSFGVALVLITALVVALPAAMGVFRIDVAAGIKAGSRSIAGGRLVLRRPSARAIIVGVESALAMVLVVAAGLLIDSFRRMRAVSLGVQPERVLTFWVIPSEARIPPAAAPAFVSRLLEAVSLVPGVQSATVDGGAPLAGSARSTLYIQGRPATPVGQAPAVLRHYVGPEHFRTLGIPLRRGRVFSATDHATAPRVVVISETAARRFWPDEDPIGRRVWFGGGSSFDSLESSGEIVGVVGDVIYDPLDRQPNLASFYTPYAQFTYASRMVFVRTVGDPMSVVPDVRKAVATVDPELALSDVQPLTGVVSGSWARHRFDAVLFGGFGLAALLLAASGVFAVLAYAVAARTREFGIRIALGANASRVVRDVLREGLVYPAAGLVAGIAGSVAVTRVLRSSLYDVSPLEPRVFATTAVLLLAVAAAACLGPAWRATRADPIDTLRSE